MMLRLQRGEPVVYLNPKDAERLGIADDGWSELSNDYGKMYMLVKYSTMVRPGVAYYFHAWEPQQFPNHESYKWLIPGLQNPMHLAGGARHLGFAINFLQAGSFVQDTRVSIRASADRRARARTLPRPRAPPRRSRMTASLQTEVDRQVAWCSTSTSA